MNLDDAWNHCVSAGHWWWLVVWLFQRRSNALDSRQMVRPSVIWAWYLSLMAGNSANTVLTWFWPCSSTCRQQRTPRGIRLSGLSSLGILAVSAARTFGDTWTLGIIIIIMMLGCITCCALHACLRFAQSIACSACVSASSCRTCSAFAPLAFFYAGFLTIILTSYAVLYRSKARRVIYLSCALSLSCRD